MTILIIATSRSGGYSLLNWLGAETGFQTEHEPNLSHWKIKSKYNVIVKYLIGQIQNEKVFEFDKWDRIIGLYRENINDCAISLINSIEKENWFEPYDLTNDWIDEKKKEIEYYKKIISDKQNYLKNIEKIKLFVTYEGIYERGDDIKKILEYVGIKNPKYLHMLNKKLKLRKEETIKKNII
jgi:hypothetical protein